MSLMTPSRKGSAAAEKAGSGKAETLQAGVVLALGGIVGAVGVDAEFECGDSGEADGVVLDLFRGSIRVEVELLTDNLAAIALARRGKDRKLLGAHCIGFGEV